MAAKFSGRIVLVAGSTGGLGRAVSLGFLEPDCRVAVSYRRQEEWDALKSATGADRQQLEGHNLDVTDETAVAGLIENRLDALINTVGGYAGGVRLWELDTRVFDQMFALNLLSGFVLSRAAVPVMLKQGYDPS
jgi:NAD(P)-dependent dehydrogenase (short-subunit alcohol dehydrogenase family)